MPSIWKYVSNYQSNLTLKPVKNFPDSCNTSGVSQISLSDDEFKTIDNRLSKIFDDGDKDRIPVKEVIDIYRDDLSKIASLNQLISIDLQPSVDFQRQQYTSSCEYLRELTQILAYRPTDYSFCKDSNFALEFPAGIPPGIPQGVIQHSQLQGPSSDNKSSAEEKNAVSKAAPIAPEPGKEGGELTETKSVSDSTAQHPIVVSAPAPPSDALPTIPAAGTTQSPPPKSVAPGAETPRFAPPSASPPFGSLPLPRQNEAPIVQQPLPASAQRDFELVSHYRFYQGLTFNQLSGLIISPPEFLAFFLVCISGILGALLRIVLISYTSGQNPTFRTVLIGPLLGLICALVVYILFRSGYIAITDRSQNGDGSVLSPFVIAFASLASGMLSKQAVERFRDLSSTWFGNHDTEQPDRWASQLKSHVRSDEDIKNLARRINISVDLLKDWLDEKSPVPAVQQHNISLVLDVPLRQLFSDISPSETAA